MEYEKGQRTFVVNCDNDAEVALVDILLAVASGASEKDFAEALRGYQKTVSCPAEKFDRNNGMVNKCGLPAGHKGKRHATFFIWIAD